jgi:hypothetical protein
VLGRPYQSTAEREDEVWSFKVSSFLKAKFMTLNSTFQVKSKAKALDIFCCNNQQKSNLTWFSIIH